ncbi:ribonuclease Oy [Scaptodrosophila lebanonensis]|uniref:Ribonuclease Oy n=1 Tax=Drosophila lebanonensis TaxID=7225 RepID=A0A6J2UD08_DROLE|nr:ribonuclease Oy [Scaptodrosophila lebanonensis]
MQQKRRRNSNNNNNLVYVTILFCCIVGTIATPLSILKDISDTSSGELSAEFLSNNGPLAEEQDYNWDVLIFTQQWPVTTCYHWREQDPNFECRLPQKKEFWTIHGIWPTKLGHVGPNTCNRSAIFDKDQLKPIENRLETYWPDLDGEDNKVDKLWSHEWLKHGTCAASLDTLDDELKYFGQGLIWREDYVMSRILDASGIHPDSNNTVTVLNEAIVKALGKNPSIHCLYGKHGISYLSEIRICFNKSLELIDCDGVKLGDAKYISYPGGTVITNCHISIPVHYPSLVPPEKREEEWKFPLVNFYKLLQFLMWFTL